MGRKGESTKNRVAKAAEKLFATKGFGEVTMSDICEASELSRGGLYRYFSSTDEIFQYILSSSNQHNSASLNEALEKNIPVGQIFEYFIRSRFSYLLDGTQNIDLTFHEYASFSEKNHKFLSEYINDSVETLTRLLQIGCDKGTFTCTDPKGAALLIFWLFEGISLHNSIIPLTEEQITEQKNLIFRSVGYTLSEK